MKQGQHIGQDDAVIRRKIRDPVNFRQQAGAITLNQCVNNALDIALIDGAQHIADITGSQVLVAECNRLVGQAEGIPHTAIGRPRQQPQSRVFKRDLFFGQNMLQVANNVLRRHPLEIELQTPGKHRHRQLLGIGGGQQELDVFRRLFQGFQKGVEGLVGEHVHLVDEVHLVAAARGSVLHVVGQFPHVIYTGAGGSIDLDQVNKPVLKNLLAAVAFTAGIRRYTGLTVQTAGQQATNGGFAHAPGAGKQIGMVQALVFQGVNKRL